MFNQIEIGRLIVKEEDRIKYKLIWSKRYSHYAFATYRYLEAEKYIGVDNLLRKPHGLSIEMKSILQRLNKKDSYRWETLKKIDERNVFSETIDLLVKAGIIILKEKNQKPAKGEDWKQMEVCLDSRAVEDVRQLFGGEEEFEEWREKLVQEVDTILLNAEMANSLIKKRLDECINEGIAKLYYQDSGNDFPVQLQWRKKYRSVLMVIAYGRKLLDDRNAMPLRTLSGMLWDDTKVLEQYQKDISEYVGEPLSMMGITSLPETIWIYGGGQFQLQDNDATSLMISKPVILTGESVIEACFKADTLLKNIIIIENLAVFMTLIKRTYVKRKDTLLLWSKGYWTGYHKKIMQQIVESSNRRLNVYIWCDLDVDGMLIAEQIYEWTQQHDCNVSTLLMSKKELQMCAGNRKLTEREFELLKNRRLEKLFKEEIEVLMSTRRTVEQENLLQFYEYVEKQLPKS